jgi:hypothetical protein
MYVWVSECVCNNGVPLETMENWRAIFVRLRDEEKERETDPLQGGSAAFSSLLSFLLMARVLLMLLFCCLHRRMTQRAHLGGWLADANPHAISHLFLSLFGLRTLTWIFLLANTKWAIFLQILSKIASQLAWFPDCQSPRFRKSGFVQTFHYIPGQNLIII